MALGLDPQNHPVNVKAVVTFDPTYRPTGPVEVTYNVMTLKLTGLPMPMFSAWVFPRTINDLVPAEGAGGKISVPTTVAPYTDTVRTTLKCAYWRQVPNDVTGILASHIVRVDAQSAVGSFAIQGRTVQFSLPPWTILGGLPPSKYEACDAI